MAKKNRDERYAYLDQFSTEQLEEILRADIESPESGDDEAIFYILEVIERRERENPTGRLVDAEKAWEEFQTCYNTPEGEGRSLYPTEDEEEQKAIPIQSVPKRKRRVLRRILIAAAIVAALAVLAVPPALGYANIFEMIGQWTEDSFNFNPNKSYSTQGTINSPLPDSADEFTSLQEALTSYGIAENVVPAWIPNGYEPKHVNVEEHLSINQTEFDAFYENDRHEFLSILIIQRSSQKSRTYEKDVSPVTIYSKNGIDHYIFENNGINSASWYVNSLECSIQTTLSDDDFLKMIDSIYER